jgi:hypothetical protein
MSQLVKGRTCGDCTLCCNVFEISEFPEKNPGEWCKHCQPGQGCGIYAERPLSCSGFRCMWLIGVGQEDDRPDKLGMVLSMAPWDDTDRFIRASPDPQRPDVWKTGRANLMLSHLSNKYAVVVSVHGVTNLIVNGKVRV